MAEVGSRFRVFPRHPCVYRDRRRIFPVVLAHFQLVVHSFSPFFASHSRSLKVPPFLTLTDRECGRRKQRKSSVRLFADVRRAVLGKSRRRSEQTANRRASRATTMRSSRRVVRYLIDRPPSCPGLQMILVPPIHPVIPIFNIDLKQPLNCPKCFSRLWPG